jgi:hypothetical protein
MDAGLTPFKLLNHQFNLSVKGLFDYLSGLICQFETGHYRSVALKKPLK